MGRRVGTVMAVLVVCLLAGGTARAHLLDHPIPSFSEPAPLSTAANSGGKDAEWELVATIPTGNAHSDLDFFTNKGDTFASVGTLGAGPNAGGQTIVQLTKAGKVEPSFVAGHPSASCITTTSSATGLQHDVEATPKGEAFPQQPNPSIAKGDGQLLIESTDGPGRCHDQGVLGQSAPAGGLEIIDITDPGKPKEIGLTVHTGQAHTVNVDPKRPHIAFDVTQDGIAIDDQGKRANETSGPGLDGFEVVDMSSCMNFPAQTTVQAKRDACRPQVYRYRYPVAAIGQSHTYPAVSSCHEVEIYPDDRMACASIDATALFDLSAAFDDNGTPGNFLDDKPRGTPLPCKVRRSSSTPGAFTTGAMVTDCQMGTKDGKDQSLIVSEWLKIGAPSLEGVKWLGTIPHMGIQTGTGQNPSLLTAPFDATQDIVAAHESEISQSGRYVFTSDERGGGVVPGGASCTPGADNVRGNGGLHAFPIGNFTTNPPRDPAGSQALYAKTKDGKKAIYRAPIRTQPQGTFCTSHVFQQIPGQNRIFMGWYSQGTQVVDFTENADGTIDFKEAAYYIPENANTWVSHIFKVQENQDGSFTYWGATGDGVVPGAGRASIDVYKVTLPAPPKPRTEDGRPPAGTPAIPVSDVRGIENSTTRPPCASAAAFEAVRVQPRGRGLSIGFSRRAGAARSARVELFRQSAGRRIIGERRVRDFGSRRGSLRFSGRGSRLGSGYYFARLRLKAADGSTDTRRIALRRSGGRFFSRPDFYRQASCELVRSMKLSSPVFGGRTGRALGVAFRLTESARVTVEVRRGSRVVKRYPSRMYAAGRFHRLRLGGNAKLRRGDHRVILKAERPGRSSTQELVSRKL